MVLIPGAEYLMGSNNGDPDEQPVHTVRLNPFFIDIHEVTIVQYKKFLDETGFAKPDFWQPELDKDDEPVVGVTWHEAAAYAAWAGKRLPTEAEWECAVRGKTKKNIYPWGTIPDTEMGNYRSFGIMPVMRFPSNDYGLYDMGGNVWEWCLDWYSKDYYEFSTRNNPKGALKGIHKVLRGGAWYCTHKQTRCANRYYSLPSSRSFNVGFRCVRSSAN
ncbi:MAG: formylglycine-generating enzyme family protein [Deltaproteobacteria bacterium]|nr:formylglycine-generating enzyme family protein [Deltaproteobacteria bacterium]